MEIILREGCIPDEKELQKVINQIFPLVKRIVGDTNKTTCTIGAMIIVFTRFGVCVNRVGNMIYDVIKQWPFSGTTMFFAAPLLGIIPPLNHNARTALMMLTKNDSKNYNEYFAKLEYEIWRNYGGTS